MENELTILVVGRTMSGKSTLVETLLHGNGESIGKGTQRTTLDVRSYEGNGLKVFVFDTPEFYAFGDRQDNKLVLEKAKTADLIFFLITDDAPQPEEAIRLAELLELGRLVFVVLNIKQTLETNSQTPLRKVHVKMLERRLSDASRYQEIEKQFIDYFAKIGFDELHFVHTHLLAAFLAQHENNSELYKLSNFEEIEEIIDLCRKYKREAGNVSSIEEALAGCRESAEIGNEIAEESFDKLKDALREEKYNLREAERKQNQINRTKNDDHFRKQSQKMERLEDEIIEKIKVDLRTLKNRQSEFTIVLYGRTMAGKSTLMSILTQDNYDKIGKGAQRTTTDVRSYEWNGLKIWDVPGIAAFGEGGRQDDKLALEKAKTADLALFLITDDAPQPEEAIRLAELKALGKPVLGIVNVKQPLTPQAGNAQRKLQIKQIEKRLSDKSRLQEIVRQFQDFAKNGDQKTFKGGYNFDDVPFVYAHLLSAQFSRQEKSSELYNLSNFKVVEDFIQDKIIADGGFIRVKTFIETLARPMQSAVAELYGHSAETFYAWRNYDDKIERLDNWRKKFVDDAQSRYNNFIADLESQLDRKVSYVVNNYYDSSYAGEHWQDSVKELNLTNQCEIFIKKISEEAKTFCRKLAAELASDLSYSGDITDWQGGIMAAAPLLMLTPVGWAGAAIVGIGAWLFGDSKEEKIRKAKNELREKLEESEQEILKNVGDSVIKNLNESVFNRQIDGFRDALIDMYEMMRELSYRQNKVADAINEQYRSLNYELFWHAVEYLQIEQPDQVFLARVVGKKMFVFSTTYVSGEIEEKISKLIGEKVDLRKTEDEDYWKVVYYVVENFILQSEFSTPRFVENKTEGDMHLVRLPKNKKFQFENKTDEILLAEQLLSDPVIFD